MNRILHARVIVQQIGYAGLGINSYSRLQVALAEAEEAIRLGDPGGRSHLIRAQILTLLLKIERNQDQRRDLRAALTQSFDQAARFLPLAYDRPDVELSWLRIVHATSLLDERAQATAAGDVDGEALFPDQRTRFAGARKDVIADLDSLIKDCTTLSRGWVARQRVFLVNGLARRAADLKEQIENSALENWKSPDVQIL
jgi:hypothetical protein